MIYEVKFTKSANKELRKLPEPISTGLIKAIYRLSADPRKGPVRPMVGSTSWRLRVGDYRVIYDISDSALTILILKAKHRKDIYKR